MDKSTTTRSPSVKGTGLVRGLGTGALDFGGLPAWVKVVSFLACHGGDAHAHNHHDWYVLVGLPKRTYYRVLGQLERDEVIEICTDERCPHAVWGVLGWRFTLRFTRWLNRPDSPFASATDGTESVPSVAHSDSPDLRVVQGELSTRRDTEVKKRAANAAVPSGHGAKEDPEMKQKPTEDWVDRTFGEDPDAPPRPKGKVKGPVGRIRAAFQEEARSLGKSPWYDSIAKMQSQVRWLLDHGYTEETIITSFRFLKNILGSNPVNQANPLWDVYYRNKVELLKHGATAYIGGRGTGPESTDNISEQARKKKKGSSWT